MALREIDVFFVEDSGPLEGCGMLRLTSCTMAQLAVQRLLPAKLVLDLSTMTVGLVSNRKILILLVDAVWSAFLPLVDPLG